MAHTFDTKAENSGNGNTVEITYTCGAGPDMETIGMGITAIAGLAGYDMKRE